MEEFKAVSSAQVGDTLVEHSREGEVRLNRGIFTVRPGKVEALKRNILANQGIVQRQHLTLIKLHHSGYVLVCHSTGLTWRLNEDGNPKMGARTVSNDLHSTARRMIIEMEAYKSKPTHPTAAAQPGEIWYVTYKGEKYVTMLDTDHEFAIVDSPSGAREAVTTYVSSDSPLITEARRAAVL